MLGFFELGVTYLKRVQFGKLKLDESLKPGTFKKLDTQEILLMQNLD
ncbi:UNVERIFIED_CONTAM: hypothetical protein O8I53_09440 [Campylobacter lari]